MTWADTKNILADKLRYHRESQVDPGNSAADIKFDTAFDVRARLYYEMWCQDVYAVKVDRGMFTSMNLSSRYQNLETQCPDKVWQVHECWIDGNKIWRCQGAEELALYFDPVNSSAGQPFYFVQVRDFIISFERAPDQVYSNCWVSGYGIQPITGDGTVLEIPSKTVDVFADYAACMFMSGVTQSRPGLTTLQMFSKHAYDGAQKIRATNLGYDYNGACRGRR